MTTTAPPSAPILPTFTRQEKLFTIVGTLLGLLLAALDNTIVATAGPRIQQDLNIEPSLYTWITTAYLVASTVMIPIYGKLSDLFGRKIILVVGVVVFLLGSLLCGVSESAWFLIFARAVQGLGSAALFTSAFAIVADLYPPAERGRITGLFGAVFGLSSVLGPLVGGFITDHFGWHWTFFVNLPVGAVALAFILLRMPALKRTYAAGDNRPQIDFTGAFWLVVGVVPLLLALSLGKSTLTPGETGFLWNSWQVYSLFGLAALGILAFLLTERRAHDPILDLSLFKNRTFAIGNLAAFVVGGAFLGPIIFLPLFMVNVVGLSATSSGLTITPLSLGIVAGNILSGQLVARTGKYKPLLVWGIVLLLAAFAIMAYTLTPSATQASVTLKMVLLGLGLGPTLPLFTLAIQNAVEPRQTGVATSSATFFRQLGNVVGVAVLGTVFANVLSGQLSTVRSQAFKDLPASAGGQFSAGGEGQSGGFDAAKIKRDALAKLDTQKADLVAALQNDDPAATKRLLANPNTPAQLRQTLEAGGIGAQVKAGFDAQRAALTAALRDGNPQASAALLQNPNTPAQLRPLLQSGRPAPQALPAVLNGLDAAQAQATRQARTQAVGAATAALDTTRGKLVQAIDTFSTGFKAALTHAVTQVFKWGMWIVALGLICTLLLPQLALRKRGEGGPPQPAVD